MIRNLKDPRYAAGGGKPADTDSSSAIKASIVELKATEIAQVISVELGEDRDVTASFDCSSEGIQPPPERKSSRSIDVEGTAELGGGLARPRRRQSRSPSPSRSNDGDDECQQWRAERGGHIDLINVNHREDPISVSFLRKGFNQNIVAGMVAFAGPGLFNAMQGLGNAGGSDPKVRIILKYYATCKHKRNIHSHNIIIRLLRR